MDQEKVEYLVNYFLHLLPINERATQRYPYLSKLEFEQEKLMLAKLLLKDFKEEIVLNLCPNCNKLARTPTAKQCRHCGHDWH